MSFEIANFNFFCTSWNVLHRRWKHKTTWRCSLKLHWGCVRFYWRSITVGSRVTCPFSLHKLIDVLFYGISRPFPRKIFRWIPRPTHPSWLLMRKTSQGPLGISNDLPFGNKKPNIWFWRKESSCRRTQSIRLARYKIILRLNVIFHTTNQL